MWFYIKQEDILKNKKIAVFLAVLFLTLTACEQQGPAEKLGGKLDNMVQDAGNQIEDSCERMKEELKAEDTDC